MKTSCRVLLFFLESPLNDIHVALLDNFHRMADDSKTHIIESHFDQTPVLGIYKGAPLVGRFAIFADQQQQ